MVLPKIVLVETSHPGNIGATARAMKTMGLTEMVLVNPKKFPDSEASAMASHADDVLNTATVVNSLEQAIRDCVRVFGASARIRTVEKTSINPKQLASKIHTEFSSGKTAIVFGRESSGLTNKELMLCDEQIHIDTADEYSSLNLAQAVQLICYELWQNQHEQTHPRIKDKLATNSEVNGMIEHIHDIAAKTDFLDQSQPKYLRFHLHGIFSRCQLRQKEVNIMRGIFSAIDKLIRRKS